MGSDGEAVRLVAKPLDEEQSRIARAQLERLAPLDEERFAPRIAVGPFGDRDQPHPFDPEAGQNFPRGLELSPPAVDDDKVWRIRKGAGLRRFAMPDKTGKTPRQHFAHHAVVVAGRQIHALDVEGTVLALDEAFGSSDHHRADRVGPHDVRIVVNLHAPDWMIDAKGLTERSDKLFLRRRFGKLARQSLLRVAQGGVDQILFFAATRRADGDAMSNASA